MAFRVAGAVGAIAVELGVRLLQDLGAGLAGEDGFGRAQAQPVFSLPQEGKLKGHSP